MLSFNCSKAAIEFFSTTKKGVKTSPIQSAPHKTIAESISTESISTENNKVESISWQWLVHVIKVKRKNIVIVMDYQSRFSITLSGLKKGDEREFLNLFEHHLKCHVMELIPQVCFDEKMIDSSIEHYFAAHEQSFFYQRSDRSVQAHINDVAWHFDSHVHREGEIPVEVELIGFDCFMNQMFRKKKGDKDYFQPQDEFLKNWLIDYAQIDENEVDHLISVWTNKKQEISREKFDALEPQIMLEAKKNAELKKSIPNNIVSLVDFKNKQS